MSVPSESYRDLYVGLGTTGPYAITFPVILDSGGNASDIKVYAQDADGTETDITAACTITGLNVTTAIIYGATYTIALVRYPALTQPYTFAYSTELKAKTIENALDRLAYEIQRMALDNDQSLKAPLSDPPIARIPSAAARALSFLGFDIDGIPVAYAGLADAPVSVAMEPVVSAVTILASQIAYGLLGAGATSAISAFIKALLATDSALSAQVALGLLDAAATAAVSTAVKDILGSATLAALLGKLGIDIPALTACTVPDADVDTLLIYDGSESENRSVTPEALVDVMQALVDIAGTPTRCQIGAGIIESGSNSNGNYIKFSDGTMEQWGFTYQGAGVGSKSVTYPLSFLAGSIPSWQAQGTNHYGGVTNVIQLNTATTYAAGIPVVTGFTVSFTNAPTFGTPAVNIGFTWRAIGPWK